MGAVSVGWSAISLAVGDKMVLAMSGAKEIDKAVAPQLYNVVEEISIASGVPMPKVMVLETEALNAFATGNRVGNGTIAVTRGLLDTLRPRLVLGTNLAQTYQFIASGAARQHGGLTS